MDGVKFVLGTELNCNGRQDGRSRRIHTLVFAPDLGAMDRISTAMADSGASLVGDGRPTVHMTPRELVETLMEIDDRCIVIPAHAWTPWFGVYGSKSGFDSLAECFGDMLGHVAGIETGLSSDPAMCWTVPELDDMALLSFSDAHSLPKLGRELTVFNGEPSYDGLVRALKTQDNAYTVEFFPEEGKYHHSGHRKCGVSYSPDDVARYRAGVSVLRPQDDAWRDAARGRNRGSQGGDLHRRARIDQGRQRPSSVPVAGVAAADPV